MKTPPTTQAEMLHLVITVMTRCNSAALDCSPAQSKNADANADIENRFKQVTTNKSLSGP